MDLSIFHTSLRMRRNTKNTRLKGRAEVSKEELRRAF